MPLGLLCLGNSLYLCSPIIGERLRIPVNLGVNSGVFGRAWRFVNPWFNDPRQGILPTGAFVRLAAGSSCKMQAALGPSETSDVGLCALINIR